MRRTRLRVSAAVSRSSVHSISAIARLARRRANAGGGTARLVTMIRPPGGNCITASRTTSWSGASGGTSS
jgi:hypothetical protein